MEHIRKSSFFILLAAVTLFIIGASYYRGLFFDTDIYWIEIVIGIIFSSYIMINFNEFKKIMSQPYVWLIIIVPLLYLIQAYFAQNQLLAFQQFFRWVMAAQFFIIMLLIKDKKLVKDIIWFSMLLMGVWTAIFGWLAAYQLVDFKDAFLRNRIASVFQYPNTFAVLLAALLLGILIRSTDKEWKYSLTSFFSFIIFITLIFTYSRGAWLIFAFMWIVTLFFLSLRKQILYLLHTILIGMGTILTLSSITESITNNLYKTGFKLIGLTAISIGLVYFIVVYFTSKLGRQIKQKWFIRWIIPVLIIVIGIGSYTSLTSPELLEKLPETIQKRISSINLETSSVVTRTLFNQNAKEMIKDYPIFGAGGGAWKEQYQRYQSFPYTSSQAHNFFYQMTIEIGLLGILTFISFLLLIIISIIKSRKQLEEDENNRLLTFGLMATLLLLHSFMDFNISYVYFQVLVIIILSMISYPLNWKFSKQKTLTYIMISVLIVTTLTSIIYSGKFIYANKVVKDIVGITFNEAEQKLDKAISLNPYEVKYRLQKISVYQQLLNKTQDNKIKQNILLEAEGILDMDQVNPAVMLQISQIYANMGYLSNSMQLLEKGIENGPWRKELYDQYIIYAFNLARYYKNQGDQVKYDEMINKINDLYNEILDKREFLDQQIPALQYRLFYPSEKMRLFVGQTYVVEDNPDEGLKLLEPLIKSKDETIKKQAIAWTIHAYDKLNNSNKVDEYIKLGADFRVEEIVEDIKRNWDKMK